LKPQDVSGLNFFEMNTIQTATNNFSISNKLGQGGFGPVYKVREFLFITSLVFSIIFYYFLCVQHQPADRPNTLELLSMLTTTSDLPPPKQPTFVVNTVVDESPSKRLITVNEMTHSMILGR